MRKAFKSFTSEVQGNLRNAKDQYGQQPLNQHSSGPPAVPQRPLLQAPTANDILSYRYHHGVNFGSIFVLEKWLFSELYTDKANGDSELDAVQSQISSHGLDTAQQNFENFWKTCITPDDWKWLVGTGCVTTVRVPIGYFTLGPNYCHGTPFEGVSQVYTNAWSSLKQMVATAGANGIGVLLDFHALPGGANSDAHSGTSSHKAEFWGNKKHLQLANQCLTFIANECAHSPELKDNVVGLQVVNEAVWDAPGMYDWYNQLLNEMKSCNPNLPVYISDAWNLPTALKYSTDTNAQDRNPVIVDTHKYYCFSDADKKKTPQQIINDVSLPEMGAVAGQAAAVVVGEYSCVLDGQSWARVASGERDGLATQFGQRQSQAWQASSGGCFFWTFKMAWFPGGEWGFAQQTNNHALPPPAHASTDPAQIQQLLTHASQAQQNLKSQAVGSHTNYWSNTSPNETMEHFRFAEGWDTGFSDAMTFFGHRNGTGKRAGADKIGFLDLWVTRRMAEYTAYQVQRNAGVDRRYFWEWSHGLREGVLAFQNIVGI